MESNKINKQELEEKIIQTLKTCYDPEIPVDILTPTRKGCILYIFLFTFMK